MPIEDEHVEHKIIDLLGRAAKTLHEVAVRSPRFTQGNDFASNDGVVRQIGQSLIESAGTVAERLLSAGEQKRVAARLHSFGVVAVQLDLFCGVRRYVALGMRYWLGVRANSPRRQIIPIKGFAGTASVL